MNLHQRPVWVSITEELIGPEQGQGLLLIYFHSVQTLTYMEQLSHYEFSSEACGNHVAVVVKPIYKGHKILKCGTAKVTHM